MKSCIDEKGHDDEIVGIIILISFPVFKILAGVVEWHGRA